MLLFCTFVGFVATSGSVTGTCVGISSKFLVGNKLLLKLLRTISLAVNNIPKLFRKTFSKYFIPLSIFLNSLAKLTCFFH